jgi:hypothetical protein
MTLKRFVMFSTLLKQLLFCSVSLAQDSVTLKEGYLPFNAGSRAISF